MAMNSPVHPGAIVREDCLKPLALDLARSRHLQQEIKVERIVAA